ncbi:cytochrome P450 2A9-like [Uloborus diversus]|uniref:cytochrome P450 2A9-like n=1 Tax=Uloborus diversus TaxID=327109 RepID=UPI002409AA37|nr:cytochrome P450 2A9-like [Uloborus diversus]
MNSNVMESINVPPWPITAAVLTLVTAVVYHYFTKDKKVPPGPIGIPYFGYFPFLEKESLHTHLEKIGEKYGDFYSFTCCGQLYIHLGSHKAVREVLVSKSDCFEVKPDFMETVFKDGLILDNGESWKVLRKYFNQYLKDSGFSTIKEEKAGPFYDSTLAIISDLTNSKGKSVNITEFVMEKSIYIIRKILLDESCMTDDELHSFVADYAEMTAGLFDMRYFLCSNLVRTLFHPRNHVFKVAQKYHDKIENLLLKVMQRSESTLDENHIRDIFDAYIMERLSRKRKNDSTAEHFSDKRFTSSVIQIIGDGITSVALFTCNFIKALLDHPEEQEKIYQEVISIVGTNRQPAIADRSKLPYTNSFMYEVMRTTQFFPLIPSLQCTKQTTIRGYRIPKDAITVFNFWAINHNPQTYENPYEFKPSRFVTDPGKPKQELPIIFGTGKRSCIGEYFTMMQSFLFLTTIVKNFKLSYPDDARRKDPVSFIEGNIYAIAEPRQD